jgi:hypothetical protein
MNDYERDLQAKLVEAFEFHHMRGEIERHAPAEVVEALEFVDAYDELERSLTLLPLAELTRAQIEAFADMIGALGTPQSPQRPAVVAALICMKRWRLAGEDYLRDASFDAAGRAANAIEKRYIRPNSEPLDAQVKAEMEAAITAAIAAAHARVQQNQLRDNPRP